MAFYRHVDVARRAGARMASDLTVIMFAIFVLLPVTVFTTRVRQHYRVVIRLFETSAVALILGHLSLSVGELAVGTGPVVKCEEALDAFLQLLFFGFIVAVVLYDTSLLFLFVIANVLLQALVEFLNPALDATEMEWLAALLAVPNGAALVDRVVTDHALLGALGE